jgi:hypothetical protein
VLESKSDNSREAKPYEIGETVKLKYLSNNPSYVKMPESFLDTIAVNVVFSALALVILLCILPALMLADVSPLERYVSPIVVIVSFPVQVIRILTSKAIIIEEIMAEKMLWQGVLATSGLCAILLTINCIIEFARIKPL